MKRPVIIDCDTGTDDAVALICASRMNSIDVRAITTVSGNVELEHTSQNTLNIVDYLRWDVPVSKGADKPLIRDRHMAKHIHGEDGLGNIYVPKSKSNFSEKRASNLIYEKALKYSGELEILAVGPLTNIALSIQMYPDIVNHIKHITIMGGAIKGGNVTETAEFNIFVDPEAAQIVFESGIPITMVGLDVTEKAVMNKNDVEKLRKINNKHSNLTADIIEFMFTRLGKGYEPAMMHDVLALFTLERKDIIKTKKYPVKVETKGEITLGQTVVDYTFRNKENIEVAIDLDLDIFKDYLFQLVNY